MLHTKVNLWEMMLSFLILVHKAYTSNQIFVTFFFRSSNTSAQDTCVCLESVNPSWVTHNESWNKEIEECLQELFLCLEYWTTVGRWLKANIWLIKIKFCVSVWPSLSFDYNIRKVLVSWRTNLTLTFSDCHP